MKSIAAALNLKGIIAATLFLFGSLTLIAGVTSDDFFGRRVVADQYPSIITERTNRPPLTLFNLFSASSRRIVTTIRLARPFI